MGFILKPITHTCGVCHNPFPSKMVNAKRCKRCKKENRREIGLGFYVYGWFFPDSQTPFYIGKGQRQRAWRKEKLPLTVEHQNHFNH